MPTILSLRKFHEGVEYFESNRSGSNFYQPRRTIRVASEILKMNLTLRSCLPLAGNQLHTSSSNWCQGSHSKLKETIIHFLWKRILTATTSVTWRSKFSAVVLQLQCASTTQAQARTTRRTSRLSARTIDHGPNRNTPQYHWMEHHLVCQLCGLWKGLR